MECDAAEPRTRRRREGAGVIKRPLNARFRNPVLNGSKTSTIRNKPWPEGVRIMLYNWKGIAYRSPQIDVAPVIVREVRVIKITHRDDGGMIYAYGQPVERRLHETEGFATREEMDAWFRPLVRRGETVEKALMFFYLSQHVPGMTWRGTQ
jgi:hypothetical protein